MFTFAIFAITGAALLDAGSVRTLASVCAPSRQTRTPRPLGDPQVLRLIAGPRQFGREGGFTVVLPALVAFGPIAFGVLLLTLFRDKYSLLWPFHKEQAGAFALHTALGFALGVMPVFGVLVVLLRDPGQVAPFF